MNSDNPNSVKSSFEILSLTIIKEIGFFFSNNMQKLKL